MNNNLKLIVIFLTLSSTNLRADTVKLTTDLWCPYACDPKSDKPGFMIEIAKEVFESKGHKIQYKLINWSRAITDVKTGNSDGLVGASKADAEGFIIPVIPTGNLVNYVWTNTDNVWSYNDVKSLQNKKIGVINDYSYGEEIDGLVKSNSSFFKIVAGEKPLNRLIQMTENKRIDGFVENPIVLSYTLKILNKKFESFKIASHNLASDPDLFIAFTPGKLSSRKYADILDEGMIELRKNGKLKKILSKYGLTDWKNSYKKRP